MHILCSITFPPENRAVNDIMWKNVVEPDVTYDNMIRRMRYACWTPKATDTHSEYVMLIAFPRQKKGYTNALQCCIIRTLPVLVHC